MDSTDSTSFTPFTSAWPGDRQALAEVLQQALTDYAADQRSSAAAQSLAQEDTVAIVCGQQPAVGGGPLYTLIKIAHCIAIAADWRAAGRSAVPVFWCASDDHDGGEADHADLLTRAGTVQRVRGPLAQRGAALHRQPAAAQWPILRTALGDLSGPRLGQDFLDAMAPQGQEGMGAWLCRLLLTLFAGHGLVAIEARKLRPLMGPAIQRSLNNWPSQALAQRRETLLAGGAAPAFPPLDEAPWFDDSADSRRHVSQPEALQLLAHDPLRLSPGAAVRPIIQQWVLPAAAYCAGPGEMAYHAFLSPCYEALGVAPPQLIRRHQLTLVDSWCARGLQQWGLRPDDLRPTAPLPSLADPQDHEILGAYDALIQHLSQWPAAGSDHDLSQRLAGATRRLNQERKRLAASLSRGQRHKQQRLSPGILRNWLYPRDQPQERVISSAQAIWHYGPGIAAALIQAAKQQTTWLFLD